MRPRRYHKVDDSQLPSFMQKYDSNRDSELIEHVIRTRERVKMRPHDVVIISYPRSGTNWLASVLTDLIPAATEAVDRLKEELSDSSILDPYLFHGYPVFWLLPDAVSPAAQCCLSVCLFPQLCCKVSTTADCAVLVMDHVFVPENTSSARRGVRSPGTDPTINAAHIPVAPTLHALRVQSGQTHLGDVPPPRAARGVALHSQHDGTFP